MKFHSAKTNGIYIIITHTTGGGSHTRYIDRLYLFSSKRWTAITRHTNHFYTSEPGTQYQTNVTWIE